MHYHGLYHWCYVPRAVYTSSGTPPQGTIGCTHPGNTSGTVYRVDVSCAATSYLRYNQGSGGSQPGFRGSAEGFQRVLSMRHTPSPPLPGGYHCCTPAWCVYRVQHHRAGDAGPLHSLRVVCTRAPLCAATCYYYTAWPCTHCVVPLLRASAHRYIQPLYPRRVVHGDPQRVGTLNACIIAPYYHSLHTPAVP